MRGALNRRRVKILLFGFLMFFLGYFTVNFVHTGRYFDHYQHQDIILGGHAQPRLGPAEHKHRHRHLPKPASKDEPSIIDTNKIIDKNNKKIKIDNNELINDEDQPSLDERDADAGLEMLDDDPSELINNTTIAIKSASFMNKSDESNVGGNGRKTRYLAFDGSGYGSVNTEIVRCGASGLEVEVTSSNDKWNSADIFYFHMSAPKTRPMPNNPSSYVMVYTMESEVSQFRPHARSALSSRLLQFIHYFRLLFLRSTRSGATRGPKPTFACGTTSTCRSRSRPRTSTCTCIWSTC